VTTLIWVSVAETIVASFEPKKTLTGPLNPVPVIVTTWLPEGGPEFGTTEVICGPTPPSGTLKLIVIDFDTAPSRAVTTAVPTSADVSVTVAAPDAVVRSA